jgi:hypothetical protein
MARKSDAADGANLTNAPSEHAHTRLFFPTEYCDPRMRRGTLPNAIGEPSTLISYTQQ